MGFTGGNRMDMLKFPKRRVRRAEVSAFEDGEYRRFYIRFFDANLEDEFLNTVADMCKLNAGKNMKLEKVDGTYSLKDWGWMDPFDTSPWGMLFRKYSALSHSIATDEETSERYHPVMLSAQLIKPCERRLA